MKILKTVFSVLILLVSGFTLFSSETNSGALKAGASMVNISPQSELFAPENKTGFAGVHDPLYVRTIVIDNGLVKAAIVTFESSAVPGASELVKLIATELGTNEENVFVSATHDHNTINTRNNPSDLSPVAKKYYELIKASTLKSVREANENLQPARVGFGEGKAYVNTNRDELIEGGYHMGYVPEGPSDKTVAVVSFTSLEGDLIAIYANYPVHAVAMYRAKTKNGLPEVTGDLPGYTSRYVEEHFEGAVALWSSGAAGDQNPLFMATYNQDHPDVFDTGTGGYAILEVLSRRLGEVIVDVTKSIKNTSSEVEIWGKKSNVSVPGRKRVSPRAPGIPNGGYLSEKQVEMVDGEPVSIPLHLLMINDIALAGVAAEVFTEIGIHLKEQSIFDRTMMVTVMPNKIGYIPTDKAFLLPAEKALSNRIKPGFAEQALINDFKEMMEEYISKK